MNHYIEKFQTFFGPLSPAQRAMFIGLVVVIGLFIGTLFYWALKPDYTLLFGSMNSETAQEIVQQLDERGVSYRLEDGGGSIFVNSDMVHQLRLELASVGLVQSDVTGYELFDNNALGMTDFMQQVNRKRALEGELARSINTLEQVESARLHLVLPERTPFQRTSVEASASVILSMRRGQRLSNEQVTGITSLIAASVEGLEASGVTVLDQNGNRLTDGLESHADYASGSLQMQLRKQTEAYLTEQGQTMLDRVLGPGNSIVRVSAEHDFDRLVRESDLIDPDSRTIISEERRSDIQNDETFQQIPIDEFTPLNLRGETIPTANRGNESTSQTRNYDVNRTRELYEKTQGEVRRLSASVLVNYKQSVEINENGEEIVTQEPYTPEEIEEFQEMVRLALGIQPNRGDELSITQIEFYDPLNMDQVSHFLDPYTPWSDIIRWGLILAAFLTILGLIYSLRKGTGTDLVIGSIGSGHDQMDSFPLEEGSENSLEFLDENEEDFIDRKLSGSAQRQLEQKAYVMEEIKEFIEMKPAEAAQVMRVIMTFDKE